MSGEFIPFTMSSYLSVTTKECTNCGTQYYDRSKSEDADFPDETPENLKNRTIGTAHFEEGYLGTDKVCFPRSEDADICAYDVEFFAVTSFGGWNITKRDGLVGLAPVDENEGPSYIENLYDQGKIESKVATLWLNEEGVQSTLTLGGIPENSIDGFKYRSHKLTLV